MRRHLHLHLPNPKSPASAGTESTVITLTLPLSLGSESDLLAAYQAAGGKIDGAMDVIATGTTVNCAGDPPHVFR